MPSKVRPEPTIPDHEVLRKIGGGAYGEVWLARGVTGALRAAKVVWHDDFEDERGFEREFEGILKYEPISRDHPGLVHILHVGRGDAEEPFYYYVMELGDDVVMGRDINPVEYEPRTLRSDMKSAHKHPLDTDFCISTGRRLAEALDHLHSTGLAHRDVKPSNVIFVDGNAKLADIGLVALRGQQTFVGTEGFVPPEGPGSAQADVYSLGKVLYEMATGKDRLDFPELPDELPEDHKELKRWRALNSAICDVCEPKISRRKIKTAGELAQELGRLERGQRRPVRVNPMLVMGIFLLSLGTVVGWQFLQIAPWKVTTPPLMAPVLPASPATGLVTVTSDPLGAEVYDVEGNYLADTPLRPHRVEIGTEVQYQFRLDGFQNRWAGGVVTEEGLVIEPELKVYSPPVAQEPWEDYFHRPYGWDREAHVSHYYVGEAEWREFEKASKRKEGQIVPLSEKGEKRRVVLATPGQAERFMQWLEDKCRDGYLTEDHVMEARIDQQADLAGVNPEYVKQGLRPFYSVVRAIPYARVMIDSVPSGAYVYLNGILRGETPLLGFDDVEPGVKVKPGKVELVLEAVGFNRYRSEFVVEPNFRMEQPLVIQLEPTAESKAVVFGREWENGLGMKFAPVGDNLMAGIWEVRVKDYRRFLTTQKKVKPPPEVEEFEQTPDHPVVQVTRDEARAFCQWLTTRERREKRIANQHEYRLPTDLEWSTMVGLEGEEGEWPEDRWDGSRGGFPWGASWPPPDGGGNFADDSALLLVLESQTIRILDDADQPIWRYADGYAGTAPVGSFEANELGIFDLAGNVHEWVDDDYGALGQHGVMRGGGWNSYQPDHLRSAARNPVRPDHREDFYGFRVVLAKIPIPPEKESGATEEGSRQP